MSRQFRNQSWQARFSAMGDEAEAVFEEVYPHGKVRYGLDRPPINVGKLSLKARYAPDYQTASGYFEVQGFGRDQLVKLKLEKELALHLWKHCDGPVSMFLWDRTNQRYGYIDIDRLTHNCQTHGDLGWLDNKRAWFTPADDLEMEWESHAKS